jgi:glycosyltransferase involved in cell wall biosynthesis
VDKKWKVPANVFLLPLIPGEEVKNIAKTPSSHENFEVEEIVFFGRLEPRKGLNLFCDAIDILATTYHKPLTVTFLGTPVDLEGGEDSVSYINERSSTWDFSVKILTTFDRESSLQYHRTSGRIAVSFKRFVCAHEVFR